MVEFCISYLRTGGQIQSVCVNCSAATDIPLNDWIWQGAQVWIWVMPAPMQWFIFFYPISIPHQAICAMMPGVMIIFFLQIPPVPPCMSSDVWECKWFILTAGCPLPSMHQLCTVGPIPTWTSLLTAHALPNSSFVNRSTHNGKEVSSPNRVPSRKKIKVKLKLLK